ncbi:hypothetical protein AM629_04650 [Photorhabdus heterorhabditis]|uniref:Transmembrane protein n=1 Tax=Photorhabdus heterorhabditis TaxID=880156 RepID=A0ABR5KFA3_9GAMM|nr:hypothetical protein AM629_04650 [Photorhabdus heterorhabditis]
MVSISFNLGALAVVRKMVIHQMYVLLAKSHFIYICWLLCKIVVYQQIYIFALIFKIKEGGDIQYLIKISEQRKNNYKLHQKLKN